MNVKGNDISIDIGASSQSAESAIGKITTMLKNLRSANSSRTKIKVDASDVDKASKKVSGLSNILSSLKRIAFYRVIRGVIKSITQAFSEGLEKAYLFSSGIDGVGHRFAAAMDLMKSQSNQMTGQLGSAFISLLTAIQPVISQLINLVTQAADAIAQFFAAFTGTTYLKANLTAAKFADNMKRGGAAAKEWKNQLLGFDEINRLNEPSKGGGGSGTNPLEGYDFIDTDISAFWLNVAEKLRPILEGIKTMFGGLSDFLTGVFTGDWDKACQGLVKIIDGARMAIGGIVDGIKAIYDNFSLFVQERVDSLLTWIEEKTGIDLTSVKEDWRTFCEESRKLVEGWCDDLQLALQGLADFLTGAFLGDWSKMGNGLVSIFDAAFTAVERIALSGVNWVITQINKVLDLVNWFTGQNWHINILSAAGLQDAERGAGWKSVVDNKLKGYATGGFPDDGQLFFARENGAGPELVGTMGGHTAVANNDQIVEGIRQGVYDAVVAANANGGGDVSVRVYLDSREIRAGQERLARAWG